MKYEFYGRVKRMDFSNKMGEFKVESSVKFNDNTYGIAFNFDINDDKQSEGSLNENSKTSNVFLVPQQLKLKTFFNFISSHSNSRFLIEFDNANNTVTKVVLCNE